MMRWLPRTRIFESDPRRWKWHTEVAPSGFWVKTRGPFMWWGKGRQDDNQNVLSPSTYQPTPVG